jgi:DNA-binding CsgD family transcriptional regulator
MIFSAMGLRADLGRDKHIVGRLQRLVPHLLRVAQLNRQLGQLEARARATETCLDRLAMAMLLVDSAGQVAYFNPSAGQIIAAGDGISLVHNKLDATSPNEGQALRHLVATALLASRDCAASPGGVMRITRRSGGQPYEVLVAPVSANTIAIGFSGPMAAVFIRDPAARGAAPLAWLQRLYSLTGAEARLMQALLAGDTLATIADRFGITTETARTHLKAVFSKTGTSSQLELLRLGLRGLAAFGE